MSIPKQLQITANKGTVFTIALTRIKLRSLQKIKNQGTVMFEKYIVDITLNQGGVMVAENIKHWNQGTGIIKNAKSAFIIDIMAKKVQSLSPI